MSEDLVDEKFKATVKRVNEAYDQAAEQLKSKVERAKSDTLKKLSG